MKDRLLLSHSSSEAVAVEGDETNKGYLHPVAGSEAAKVGAGLFLKPPM